MVEFISPNSRYFLLYASGHDQMVRSSRDVIIQPWKEVQHQSLAQHDGCPPLKLSRLPTLQHSTDVLPFPSPTLFICNFNHTSSDIQETNKVLQFRCTEVMASLYIKRDGARHHERAAQPVFLLAQIRLRSGEIGVDVRIASPDYIVDEGGRLVPELVVQAARAKNDEAWGFEVGTGLSNGLERSHNGVCGVLTDCATGLVVDNGDS